MTHAHQTALLTQGSVARRLAGLTAPMVWGLMAAVSQPIVDTYFVGQLGTPQLAAMSYIFPIAFIFSSVIIGLGIGTSAVLSRLIGAQHWEGVRQTNTHGLLLTFAVVAALMLIGLVSLHTLFSVMGAGPEVMAFIARYMKIWYGSILILALPMAGTASLRAKGASLAASSIMTMSALANLILDPILIFGYFGAPEMGFVGAAWASVGANLAASLLAIYILVVRENLLDFHRPDWTAMIADWRSILQVGLPAALTNLISPLSAAVVVSIVSGLGEAAVAGFGVAVNVEAFALIVPQALSAIIGPFVGQNFGAGLTGRIHRGMALTLSVGAGYGALMAVVLALSAHWIGARFRDDPQVIAAAATYLALVPASYCFVAVIMVVAGAFNALGAPRPNMMFYAVKLIGLYIPLAALGVRIFGFTGIAYAAALSNILTGVLAFYWYRTYFPALTNRAAPAMHR